MEVSGALLRCLCSFLLTYLLTYLGRDERDTELGVSFRIHYTHTHTWWVRWALDWLDGSC